MNCNSHCLIRQLPFQLLIQILYEMVYLFAKSNGVKLLLNRAVKSFANPIGLWAFGFCQNFSVPI